MKTSTVRGMNNSHGLFWEGRTDTNFTTQNTWLYGNKYTSDKNSLMNTHFKLYENIPSNGRGMVIWKKYYKGLPPIGKPGQCMTYTDFQAWGNDSYLLLISKDFHEVKHLISACLCLHLLTVTWKELSCLFFFLILVISVLLQLSFSCKPSHCLYI